MILRSVILGLCVDLLLCECNELIDLHATHIAGLSGTNCNSSVVDLVITDKKYNVKKVISSGELVK